MIGSRGWQSRQVVMEESRAMKKEPDKLSWRGRLVSVQPRIRLTRSFDQRSHSYLGYVLTVEGIIGDEQRQFTVAIGKGAQAKHGLKVGDVVSGQCESVEDERLETAGYYKVSRLKVVERGTEQKDSAAPWLGVAPQLEVYRARGHRRLDARTYEGPCSRCIWGCRMAVEMIIDQWNPSKRRYRFETFCYGPKSCRLYKAGPTRKVPGRKGMSWEEEDWVDEEAVGHRGMDE